MLRIDRKGVKRETSYPDILRLLPFDISPAYAGRHFVYRRSDVRFETDFYNRFLLAPATNIAEETRRWLAESGLFQAVVKRSAAEKPACYLLEASIDALYIDRSEEASQAVAVLEVEFLLAKLSGQRQLYRRYSQTAPAKGEAPEDLFRAYRQALRQVLQLLEHDLAEQPEKRGCSR